MPNPTTRTSLVDWQVGDRIEYRKGSYPKTGRVVGTGYLGAQVTLLILFDGEANAVLVDLKSASEHLAFLGRGEA